MVMDGVLDNYARLLPGGVNFTGPKELTQYYVQDFRIQMEGINQKAAVVVSMGQCIYVHFEFRFKKCFNSLTASSFCWIQAS